MPPTQTSIDNYNYSAPPPAPPRRPANALVPLLLIVVLGGGIFGVYTQQLAQAQRLDEQNVQLNKQLEALKVSVQKQDDINKGVVKPAAKLAASGVISLANNKISLKLPDKWTRQPAGMCGGGATIESRVLCHDITTITDDTKQFVGTVAVYDYDGAASAKDWVEKKYFEPLASSISPVAKVLSADSVNGNSAFGYSVTSGAEAKPDYVNYTYVVAHETYAVVLTSQVQAAAAYANGKPAYDYRSGASLILPKIMDSVTFKD